MSKEEITSIPYIRRVFYATYANLPVAGLRIGDLGYATDRLVFYRWSGAAWQAVTIHSSSGTAANIPVAADLPEGSLYYATDTKVLSQIQAGAWVDIMTPGLSFTLSGATIFSAAGTVAWTDLDISGTVGAKPTLCLIAAYSTVNDVIAIRQNGDALEYYTATPAASMGAAIIKVVDGVRSLFVVNTDANGILEVYAKSTFNPLILVLISYLN